MCFAWPGNIFERSRLAESELQPLSALFGGLSYRRNLALNQEACAGLSRMCAERQAERQADRAILIPVSPAA